MKAIILSLFLVGCAVEHKSQVANFPGTYKVYNAKSECVEKKRIYLTHGFGGDKSTYDKAPFVSWIENLRNACFQIISYDLPQGDYTSHFVGGGETYRNNFVAFLDGFKRQIDAKFGYAMINIHGGVSFGGLHSMMAIELTNHFDGFFALKPVTDYTALDELKAMSSQKFNVWNDVQKLASQKGLIIWGNQDLRIDYTLTIKLLNDIGVYGYNNTTSIELNEGHASNDGNLQMILDWLNNNY